MKTKSICLLLAMLIISVGETEAASKKSWDRFWNSVDVFKFNRSSGLKSWALNMINSVLVFQ